MEIRKFGFATLALASFIPRLVSGQESHPNLLFIMTDQQRYDALSIVGKFPFLKTPNLDKLAREGVLFERTYTQCAVSAPARGTLFTGCSVENHGIYTNAFDKGFTTPMKTFDEILVENGYYAEYHGKFHSPNALRKCYTQFSEISDYNAFLAKALPKQAAVGKGERINPDFKHPYRMNPMDASFDGKLETTDDKGMPVKLVQPDYHGELLIPQKYSMTNFQGNQVIEAIKRAKESGKPFSVTCSFTFPHSPMLPTKPYAGMYPVDQMPVSPSLNDDMKNSPYFKENGRLAKTEYSDPEKIRYMMADYFALVTEIDDKVGEILLTLKENGFDKNTLVIFTSDHGEMLGSHGMREKNVFYEESARIPLMIRFPKSIKAGRIVSQPISNMNLCATILDYLGIKGHTSDGSSLRPLIEGTKTDKFDFVVTEWNFRLNDLVPNYMIVKGDWKMFIPYTPTSKVLDAMYDLKKDPYEMNNLLGNNPDKKQYEAKANELKQDLLKWLKDTHSSHYEGVKERNLLY
jgi:arylsulfatase A-like enzyme